MSNAELSIRLFLGSVCMFSFALGVNQAGWRHGFLIVSLFVLSGISGLGAVFYPSVSGGWPTFTSSLESIASNAWAWFGLIALLSVSVVALSIRDRIQATRQTTTEFSRQPTTDAPGTTPRQRGDTEEKIIVNVTPEYLMGLFPEEKTQAQGQREAAPYIGKWVKWSGAVNNSSVVSADIYMVSFNRTTTTIARL